VEWLKVEALNSNLSTAKKQKEGTWGHHCLITGGINFLTWLRWYLLAFYILCN
jgi:hypothetical protein